MKLIIAGTRTFDNSALLKKEVEAFVGKLYGTQTTLVCGLAPGADMLGYRYAVGQGWQRKGFKADWEKHGPAAGPLRNRLMAKFATHCIVFWDGKSRGTASMIEEAKRARLVLKIVTYAPNTIIKPIQRTGL